MTAVDRHGARAAFSTRRWYATVAAPGKEVLIADPDRRYYEGWGTSAASAFASGAVALVRAAHPDLSPAQIKELISDTARNTPEGGRSDALGTGVVDPAAAIEMGSNIKPRKQQPSQLPYRSEYFGAGPEGGPERRLARHDRRRSRHAADRQPRWRCTAASTWRPCAASRLTPLTDRGRT